MSTPRILIVKFSAIGDCVMGVPTAAVIRRRFPDSFIAWAVDPRCGDVLDDDHLLSLKFEVPREKWKKGGPESSWLAQLRHFAKLRQYGFDYGLDLQGHSKTALCLRLAKPKKRLAMRATDPFVKMLNPVMPASDEKTHMVKRNLEVLRTLTGITGEPEFLMPKLDVCRKEKLVSIAISTGHFTKTVPVQVWESTAEQLIRQGFEVAFLGGPTDPHPKIGIDYVGKLPLIETMKIVAQSAVHLAGDTGTGHIAAAYGVPVVSVFRNTAPEIYRPFTDLGKVLAYSENERDMTNSLLEAANGFATSSAP